jgi:hypothetical protein
VAPGDRGYSSPSQGFSVSGQDRGLALLTKEPGVTLGDVQVATAAMGALGVEPESEKALEALVGLIRAR